MSFDPYQLQYCIDYMIGFKSIGSAQEEEIQVPFSPELRAFIQGKMGDKIPSGGWDTRNNPQRAQDFANFLREIADALDPQ